MTYDEWKTIVVGLKKIYFSKKFLADEQTIKSWYFSLKDYDIKYIKKACRNYYESEYGKISYPQIRDLIKFAEEAKKSDSNSNKYVFGKLTMADCRERLNLLIKRLEADKSIQER